MLLFLDGQFCRKRQENCNGENDICSKACNPGILFLDMDDEKGKLKFCLEISLQHDMMTLYNLQILQRTQAAYCELMISPCDPEPFANCQYHLQTFCKQKKKPAHARFRPTFLPNHRNYSAIAITVTLFSSFFLAKEEGTQRQKGLFSSNPPVPFLWQVGDSIG